MKYVLIAAVSVLVIAAAAVCISVLMRRPAPVETRLASVSYTVSGDMEGGYYDVSLTVDRETRRAWVEVRKQTGNRAKEYRKKKAVGTDCCLALEKLIADYGMEVWKDLPPAEVMTLDAANSSVHVQYQDGTYFSFSDTRELPKEAFAAMRELVDCMLRFAGLENMKE